MMETNIFNDKSKVPTNAELVAVLGSAFPIWKQIHDFTIDKYPAAIEEWNYPGVKYGWSFRIKDKKRAIVYLLPYSGFFKVALVFGNKAMEKILDSTISQNIKTELQNAKAYAEGRGIRIEVKDETLLADIKKLIEIKINAV